VSEILEGAGAERLNEASSTKEREQFLREREELRGVLNAGHDPQSAKAARCVGDESEPRVFNVWAPVAFAGIGKQHDTLMDLRDAIGRLSDREWK
jgi:hypothetical protein